jgi:hypothetical protein
MRAFILMVMAAGGCATVQLEAKSVSPSPVRDVGKPDELPTSSALYIHSRDKDLPYDFQLRSSAQFSMVSQDRIRFHLGIARQDEEEADVRGWKVVIEDDTGRRYEPQRELPVMKRLALNWRLWPYQPGDSWCQQPPCLSRVIPGYEAFEGSADYTIHETNFLRNKKRLTLLATRHGVTMRFTWNFADGNTVEHYGRSKADEELGTILVPGPNVQVAQTTRL